MIGAVKTAVVVTKLLSPSVLTVKTESTPHQIVATDLSKWYKSSHKMGAGL